MGSHTIAFSVVVTVLNEHESIDSLMSSLVSQMLLPDEIVVVDAGSTDGTIEKIKQFGKQHTAIGVHLMVMPGVNRSQGRNVGIKAARNDHIAVTDAGCVARKDWLAQLAAGFKKEHIDTVAGFYQATAVQEIEKIFSWFMAVQPEQLDSQTFLPSSRSLAFTKKIWLESGKYPEHLNTCEDLVFAQSLKHHGHMNVASKAIVDWIMPRTMRAYFKQISGYAKGDVQARYRPHLKKHGLVWLRYILFAVYPLFLLVYPLWPILKHRKRITNLTQALWLVPVQVITDLAIMWGGLRGLRC
jgi:glycosyltransferase involved in cell wall biosynthesis